MNSKHYDAGDQSSVDKKRTESQSDKERIIESWKQILSTYEGREVFWAILGSCDTPGGFTGAVPGLSYYYEGKRDVALGIRNDIDAVAPNAYTRMREEAYERELRKDG